MTELSGTLNGVGLPTIVRFLVGLNKTGSLRLSQGDWRGEVYFDAGQVSGARFGSRDGLAALDALAESLPHADFEFESHAPNASQPTIRLDQEAICRHLDDLARRIASGARTLPVIDAVPSVVDHEVDGPASQEPLALDRGTLQTLLAVDGQRNVRDIVAQRGSFDALWQMGKLLELGLISVAPAETRVVRPVVAIEAVPRAEPPALRAELAAIPAEPRTPPAEPRAIPAEPPATRLAAAAVHCPKLGFEDDPQSSFGRPTRLHRCFAAESPLPLSVDQQRELCLTEQYATCPRLVSAPAAADPQESRIVRLPLSAPRAAPRREAASAATEPARLRAAVPAARGETGARPTPLRTRIQRPERGPIAPPASAVFERAAAGLQPVADAVEPTETEPTGRRVGGGVRIAIVAGAIVGILVIAAAAFVLLAQPGSAPAAVQPPPAPLARPTTVPAARPTTVPAVQPTSVPAVQPSQAGASATRPTTQANTQPAAVPQAAAPGSQTGGAPATGATLLDEHFTNPDAGWPNNPQGAASIVNGTYRIGTSLPGQFVSIGAPVANLPADLVVNASFQKLAGPAGGGYGIIVRDQRPGPSDGTRQDGQYYVLEAGDKGDVGIWRRDNDHWVDLMPWQHATAVKPGNSSNDLSVRVVGSTLTLSVNGTTVATRTDAALSSGGVGLFVGGDGNQVAVNHFSIQTP